MNAAPAPEQLSARSRRAIVGLAVTQFIGWGTTFNMPGVLGVQVGQTLNMPREFTFGGITVMLLVSAALAPAIGRRIDAGGGRNVMCAGSLIASIGLAAMSQSVGPISWFAGWVFIGVALPMMVGMGALASLAYLSGGKARRAIATLMLFTGFSSAVFWPLGGVLDAFVGWRWTLAIYAALHLAICLPIHAVVMRGPGEGGQAEASAEPAAHRDGLLPAGQRKVAFLLLALALTCQGALGWGLTLHIIDLIEACGHSTALAISLGALHGPAQLSARLIDWLTGSRLAPLRLGLLAMLTLPLAPVALMVAPGALGSAVAFVLLYGAASGMMSIARSTIPLSLFGAAEFGAYLGRLSMPLNIVFAFAPIAFAAALSRGGAQGALWLAFGIALGGLFAILALARHCRAQAARPSP